MTPVPDATRPAEAGAARASPQLLQWPDDQEAGAALVALGQPCVWPVPPGVVPPKDWSDIEDWVRIPADPVDLMARLASVVARAHVVPLVLHVDTDDMLWCEDECVALSKLEARLMRVLLRFPRQVVNRDTLAAETWPGDSRDPATILPTPIKVLRRKIAPLGLSIHTVPSRGYLLETPPRPLGRGPGANAAGS